MEKKKICFIAQFPPPIHGLSKAVETLFISDLSQKYEFEKVDITNNKKILHSVLTILRSRADLFYLTISQSKGGNFRDLLIMWLLRRKKVLVHLHGGYYRKLVDQKLSWWQKKANYISARRLAGGIVLGPSLKYIFEGMLPDEKIYTVFNCVDDEFLLSDIDFERKLEKLSERRVKHVLYLSNFVKSKGYLKVLELAKMEKQREGERCLHFDFAGKFFEKNDEDFFWNYVYEYGLEDYITYHGIVSGEYKRELLAMCDVFILLTTYPNEGQPISILEAMGNGLLVVTTDHAGIPDIVRDGINGIVENKNAIDVRNIYDKILNYSEYSAVMEQNRKEILTKYTESNYTSHMEQIWEEILK